MLKSIAQGEQKSFGDEHKVQHCKLFKSQQSTPPPGGGQLQLPHCFPVTIRGRESGQLQKVNETSKGGGYKITKIFLPCYLRQELSKHELVMDSWGQQPGFDKTVQAA